MGRRRVDAAAVGLALAMRDDGAAVAEILAATGLSQGTYYSYVHSAEADAARACAEGPLGSPLTWPGSKASELERILPHVPIAFDRYVEPFLGGGSLFWHLRPHRALLSDASPELVALYGALRDRFWSLRRELRCLEAECASTGEGAGDLYYRMRDVLNGRAVGDVSQEAAFLFVNKTSFSGLMRRNALGEFNVPYGKGKRFHAGVVAPAHSFALRGAELLCCDFEGTLSRCVPGDFVFLDPPYDSAFADYSAPFGHDEHRRLAEAFHALPCKALMVVGRTPLTMGLYGDCVVDEYARDYGVNIRGRVTSTAVHLVVMHEG